MTQNLQEMNMFIKDFENRGFLYQCTDLAKLTELMKNYKIAAYIGFDCTAESLHVGSLMQIMILRLLQQFALLRSFTKFSVLYYFSII